MLVPLNDSHRALIHQIRTDAEDWLEARDIDQYRRGLDPAIVRRNSDRQIEAGQFFGWPVGGRIVAVVALTEPDDLWSEAERAEPQTYIGRLYVGGTEHGKGYGAAVVEAVQSGARPWRQVASAQRLEHKHPSARLLRSARLPPRPDRRQAGPHERCPARARPHPVMTYGPRGR